MSTALSARKRLVLSVIVICVLAGGLVSQRMPPIYYARAVIDGARPEMIVCFFTGSPEEEYHQRFEAVLLQLFGDRSLKSRMGFWVHSPPAYREPQTPSENVSAAPKP